MPGSTSPTWWQGLRAEPDAGLDLVLAADAVIYLPDLVPLVLEAARVLRPGGVLAFTTETHGGAGVVLGTGCAIAMARISPQRHHGGRAVALRSRTHLDAEEKGEPVPGLV